MAGRFRLLNVIDDFNREILAIEADTSLPTARLIRVLEYLKEFRGLPSMIRVDNGPEFISQNLDCWCKQNKIRLAFIQPGKPMQNAYVERFNGNIREGLLKTPTSSGRSGRSGKRPRNGWRITTAQDPTRRLAMFLRRNMIIQPYEKEKNPPFNWPLFEGSLHLQSARSG